MFELVAPANRLRTSWLQARDEWGHAISYPGSGLRATDDVETAEGFDAWIQRLHQQSDESIPVGEGLVHATYWWVVEHDVFLGSISLRHRLNDFLLRAGGHVGYGIRPSARGRGAATWALGAVLAVARTRGMGRVLVTCDDENLPSARTIETNGGVLEDIRMTELGRTRRHWIDFIP